jgi:hypothetical protein
VLSSYQHYFMPIEAIKKELHGVQPGVSGPMFRALVMQMVVVGGVVVVRQMAIETIEYGIWFLVSCCAFCYICNCMIFGFLAPFL